MKTMRIMIAGLAVGLTTTAMTMTSDTEAEETTQLKFVVGKLEPKRGGKVLCALYDDQDRWLGRHPVRHDKQKVEGVTVTCVFKEIPPGTYAVAAMHDEDGDEEMDKNLIGLPTEGYCASRDAHENGFGAPDWEDAAFRYNGKSGYSSARMTY